MKKVGYFAGICSMLFACTYAGATPLDMAQVERQVMAQTQKQYSPATQFFLALKNLQINARINSRDENKFISGVFDLAEKYANATKGRSQLYAIELYGYMNQRLATQTRWSDRTVASYVIKSLRKRAKHAEFPVQKRYFKIANQLSEIRQLEDKYFPVMAEVAHARTLLVDVKMSKEIAQAQVRREDLTTPYLQEVSRGLKPLVRLGKALAKADETVLPLIVEGFKEDPLKAVDVPVNVEKFLALYGGYTYSQDDGSIVTNIGYKMLQLKQQ